MMKQIIDTVDAPAMLERMQAFKEVLEASLEEKIKASTEKGDKAIAQVHEAHRALHLATFQVIGVLLPFVPSALRQAVLEAVDFLSFMKGFIPRLAREPQYIPPPGDSMEWITRHPSLSELKHAMTELQRTGTRSSGQTKTPSDQTEA